MDGIRKIDEYSFLKIEKYKGKFSLVLGQEKENIFYSDWRILSQWDSDKRAGVPRLRDDGSFFRLPTSITLGESEEEVKQTLEWIYTETQKANKETSNTNPDNVPF